MAKNESKTPEALAAEQVEIAKMRLEIAALCNRVPQSVLVGSVQTAIAWKKAAHEAYWLAQSKAPTLTKLHNARRAMLVAAKLA